MTTVSTTLRHQEALKKDPWHCLLGLPQATLSTSQRPLIKKNANLFEFSVEVE